MVSFLKERRSSSRLQSRALSAFSPVLLAVALGLVSPNSFANEESEYFCEQSTFSREAKDYRLRESLRGRFNDNLVNHLAPAIDLLDQGIISRRVMSELDWTLERWPNHLLAFNALIRYSLAGGRIYEFQSAACYFARGRNAFPDDAGIVIAEAFYWWKTGEKELAKATYDEALQIAPGSPEAHYHLGLLHVELSEFDQALEHAHAAYAGGYPLPGLRNALARRGHWQDPVQQSALSDSD